MSLTSDLHFTGRRLLKAPGFVLDTILMLGLGIGLSVSMVSVVRGVLLGAGATDADATLRMIGSTESRRRGAILRQGRGAQSGVVAGQQALTTTAVCAQINQR